MRVFLASSSALARGSRQELQASSAYKNQKPEQRKQDKVYFLKQLSGYWDLNLGIL